VLLPEFVTIFTGGALRELEIGRNRLTEFAKKTVSDDFSKIV